MRLFVAVDLPEPVRATLDGLSRRLREELGRLRWVRPGSIHLTLRFLGEIPVPDLGKVRASLAQAVPGAAPPFGLRVAGAGTFPERGRPRVIWVGLEEVPEAGNPPGSLAALQNRIEEAVRRAGLPPQRRPFRPHLTLARVGDARLPSGSAETIALLAPPPGEPFQVESVWLFESRLRPEGAEYRKLEEYRL